MLAPPLTGMECVSDKPRCTSATRCPPTIRFLLSTHCSCLVSFGVVLLIIHVSL